MTKFWEMDPNHTCIFHPSTFTILCFKDISYCSVNFKIEHIYNTKELLSKYIRSIWNTCLKISKKYTKLHTWFGSISQNLVMYSLANLRQCITISLYGICLLTLYMQDKQLMLMNESYNYLCMHMETKIMTMASN